ncbi:MAG: pilin [Candidatus Altiarchaeota archaeon]
MTPKKTALLLMLAAQTASALACWPASTDLRDKLTEIINQLLTLGSPIAFLMMVYMGIKWYMAEGPEDRENARRGIIYVVIGLIMLRGAQEFVHYLLC